jgi:beta-lactamase class A
MRFMTLTLLLLTAFLLTSIVSMATPATSVTTSISQGDHQTTDNTAAISNQSGTYRSFIPLISTELGPAPEPNSRAAIEIARRWALDDAVVANGNIQRPWTWGALVFRSMTEPYAEAPNSWRTVWYLDKGRMEVTYPNANPDDVRYVTSGALVVEMLSGQIRTGERSFNVREPADLHIVGDAISPSNTITYRDLVPLASLNGDRRSLSRIGATVIEVLGKDGKVSSDSRFGRYAVRLSTYDDVSGHNIPQVFTDAMTTSRLISRAGHPLTEPYWITIPIGGILTDVLIQPFERRVLLYTPSKATNARVEWANVGRQYAQWRYGSSQNVTPFDPRTVLDAQSIRPLAELSLEARRIAYERQANVGVAVLNMRSGEMFTFSGTQIFPTYSTVKTPIMLTLLQQAHQQRRAITQEEDQLIRAMIQYSDNSATDTLYHRIGGAASVGNYLRSIGITNTTMGSNWLSSKTTAQDMARLMAKLGNCTILTPELCNYALTIMRGVTPSQRWGVSAGVPQSGSVALKNGWFYEYTGAAAAKSDGDADDVPFIPPRFFETTDWADDPAVKAAATIWTINSIGFIRSEGKLYAIAVYTYPNPSKQYGIDTIEGISRNVYPAVR